MQKVVPSLKCEFLLRDLLARYVAVLKIDSLKHTMSKKVFTLIFCWSVSSCRKLGPCISFFFFFFFAVKIVKDAG